MEFNNILSSIRPIGTDENGKYNKKLFNLLKRISKERFFNNQKLRIWFNTKSRWDGSDIEFHRNIHKDAVGMGITKQIMIDPQGGMVSGYFLSEALQKNNPTRFSLRTFNSNHMIDITKWFFETYIRIGRCMFDRYHYDFENNYNNRYYIINKNNRKCRWCEEHFHREIKKRVEVKKYEKWIGVSR